MPKLARVGPGLLLALAALVPFLQLLSAGFLNYDDPLFLTQQPFWSRPSFETLLDVWSRPIYGSYHPLHQTSYFVDRVVWGQVAWGVRLTNLALYGAILAGFCVVGRRLSLPRAGVLCGGLLYAWHPSHVENVAWLSQRKDLLSAALLLAAFAVYLGPRPHPLRAPEPPLPSWPRVGAAAGLLVLGLLSKSVTVVLIPWLVLLALGRGSLRREASRLALLTALGVAATLGHYLAQDALGAAVGRPPPAQHLGQLMRALGHYGYSAVAPLNPAPRLPLDTGWTAPQALGLALCAVWFACSWRWASLRTWGLMAVAGIGPMWGIVPLPTFVHDRYLLWASLPLGWAVGAGVARLGRNRRFRALLVTLVLALALGELAVSYPYAATWSSGRALWTANQRAYPQLAEPREALVQLYSASPDPAERELAARMAREILAVDPTRLVPNLVLAQRALDARDYAGARAHYTAATDAQDNTAYRAPLLLAALELELGDLPAARAALERAGPPRSPPDAPEVLAGWASYCLANGDLERARSLAADAAAKLPEWDHPWELLVRTSRRLGDAQAARQALARVSAPDTRRSLQAFLALDAGDLDAAARLLRRDPAEAPDLELELARACLDAKRGELESARARRQALLARASPGARRRIESEPSWPE
ncbi:MAG: hypothetical protein KDD82_06225 [Planctomycetes bacterium]|nr:hypothetical protein [Planctomycetota bacterium]